MSEYTIRFKTGAEMSITVEAEDIEAAVDEAYRNLPSGVCAQCSGWGRDWNMDMGEWEVDEDALAEEYPNGEPA